MPKHWGTACLFNNILEDWTTPRLLELVSQAIIVFSDDSKICIFIDVLDEFGDDHDNLVSMIHSLIERNTHVKLCIASRPWDIFQRLGTMRISDWRISRSMTVEHWSNKSSKQTQNSII